MSSNKKTKKEVKEKRRARYGMTKIRNRQKFAWVSQQNKHGFSLGLALEGKTIWLRNTRFASKKEVERALFSKVVFISVKDL